LKLGKTSKARRKRGRSIKKSHKLDHNHLEISDQKELPIERITTEGGTEKKMRSAFVLTIGNGGSQASAHNDHSRTLDGGKNGS